MTVPGWVFIGRSDEPPAPALVAREAIVLFPARIGNFVRPFARRPCIPLVGGGVPGRWKTAGEFLKRHAVPSRTVALEVPRRPTGRGCHPGR